jgi:hypothetical protein
LSLNHPLPVFNSPEIHKFDIAKAIEESKKILASCRFHYDPTFKDTSLRECCFGGLGTYKSVVLVREACWYHYLYPDRPIIANIPINLPNFIALTSAKMLFSIDFPCFLGLDEGWQLADSRKRGLMIDIMNMFMLRSRKRKWWVVITEQYHTQVDLRIRFITDVFCEPKWNKRVQRVKVPCYTKYGFRFHRYKFDPKPVFEYFDTEADPLTLDVKELEDEYNAYLARKKWGLNR